MRLQAEAAGTAPQRYGGMGNALRLVVAEEGVLALWKGMAPSALRELSYSTLRFGLYAASCACLFFMLLRAVAAGPW